VKHPDRLKNTEQEENRAALESIAGIEMEVAEEITVAQHGLLILNNPESE